MPIAYNGSGTGNIGTVLGGVNEITGGLFGVFFLLLVFGVVYFFNRGEPTREAMVGATFVTMISAIFGFYIGFITDYHLGFAIVAFIGSLVMLINRQ